MSMYDLLISVVGAPHNDIESLTLYLGGVAMSVVLVYSIVYLMKIIGDAFKS